MELRGNLKDFSLPDIIQLVGFGRKTGVLKVECENGGAALFFEEGDLVHAERPGASGEEAVYSLFQLPEGEFRFQTEVLPPTRSITMDSTNLVMEAARLLDESRRDSQTSQGEWHPTEATDSEDWGSFEGKPSQEQPRARTPGEIKDEIQSLLKRRFGRQAKRLLRAVDRCGDSVEELLDLANRVEKYVQVFLDNQAALAIGREIRDLISGPPTFLS